MSKKEFIKNMISNYFIIVTLINVATYILGSIFRSGDRFGYDAFLSPLVYGLFSLIPFAVMYSKRELSIHELMVRKVLQLLSIEVVLFVFGYGIRTVKEAPIGQTVGFGLSILIIYVLVNLIDGWLNAKDAKELNQLFLTFQSSQKEQE